MRLAPIAAMMACLLLNGCDQQPKPGKVLDEARQAGRQANSFPAADEDYFHDMDGGVPLQRPEVRGRNTWLLWSAGNDRFWDVITQSAYGSFDLVKILSSFPDPNAKFSRDNRWTYFGLVNEPCFHKPSAPGKFGLWLDERDRSCGTDPFADDKKYPGVKIGARGATVPVGSFYGEPSGIVGLRLFPNPAFDEKAKRAWDPKRYYTDPKYYLSKDLVRPYRVGMTCAFCHVGPNPVSPPADPEKPEWKNLSSNVGAQYFWIDRIFAFAADKRNFMFQLVHTARPGTLDTSLISTDNINNPRTMNAVYELGPRLVNALKNGKETLNGGGLDNRQFSDFTKDTRLTAFFAAPKTVWTPHVLKDGADSVGALGALNRVFVNIGLFSEEWLLHFNALVGGKEISPIKIEDMRKNSSYWGATEAQTPDLALFFLKTTSPHHLADAPGGKSFLTADATTLTRGKAVFAENCARCHSSKAPVPPPGKDPAGCTPSLYLRCWNAYWAWTNTETFKQQMRQIVLADDFLDKNYLSNDLRIPVTLLQTNLCSPLASNGIKDNIWDNFTSQSYKDLPSVGTVTYFDPFTGAEKKYTMPAGGRGYTRVPSLISLWSTAPYLLNNSVGTFNPSPSVDARLASFDNSIRQMLWPQLRAKDPILGNRVPGIIDRTTARSYLSIPTGYLPTRLRPLLGVAGNLSSLVSDQGIEIGPIPAGTPVNLLANLQLLPETANPNKRLEHDGEVIKVALHLIRDLKRLPSNATDDQARQIFSAEREHLMSLSKCPDFVVNRGHYFGTRLADRDKEDLIGFLKTF
jgi:hypothetical protein